jgi:large subunit ribosomal protein L9
MKVILTTDVDSVGYMGEIKDVKRGLARNYLLPKKLAVEATAGNIKIWDQKQRIVEKHQIKRKEDAENLSAGLQALTCSIKVKVGDEGKLFGSVTTQNISDELAAKGFKISKKDIVLDSPIKEIGSYDIAVKIHPEVKASVKVEVENEEEQPEVPQEKADASEQTADVSDQQDSPDEQPQGNQENN